MYRVILEVQAPSSWALDIASQNRVPIVILDCIPHGEMGAEGLIEVEADEATQKKLIRSLEEHPDVSGLRLAQHSDGKLLASVMAKDWVACSTILKCDCYFRGARTIGNDAVEWRLLFKDERSISRLIKDLETVGCNVTMKSKSLIKEPYALTKRQEQVVRKAWELGYYDFPSRISAKELSQKLGISASTISEILRRSERKLVEYYLRNRL